MLKAQLKVSSHRLIRKETIFGFEWQYLNIICIRAQHRHLGTEQVNDS